MFDCSNRVHNLYHMEKLYELEAHDSEVLCLQYTNPETGGYFTTPPPCTPSSMYPLFLKSMGNFLKALEMADFTGSPCSVV